MDRFRQLFADLWESLPVRLAESRVHLLAFAGFALGLLETLDPYALASILPPRYSGVLLIGLSVGIYLLRSLMPPSQSGPYESSTEEGREG